MKFHKICWKQSGHVLTNPRCVLYSASSSWSLDAFVIFLSWSAACIFLPSLLDSHRTGFRWMRRHSFSAARWLLCVLDMFSCFNHFKWIAPHSMSSLFTLRLMHFCQAKLGSIFKQGATWLSIGKWNRSIKALRLDLVLHVLGSDV